MNAHNLMGLKNISVVLSQTHNERFNGGENVHPVEYMNICVLIGFDTGVYVSAQANKFQLFSI